mgnify:CR=1 FL=1
MFKHVKTDPELCIGCKTCMAACVASHTGKALFALKPKSFDVTPRVHVVYTSKVTKAVQCQQCPKPRCMEACPFHCISLGSGLGRHRRRCLPGLREVFPCLPLPGHQHDQDLPR